jgi:tetratricopeptide (TPR) repeat protein
VVTIQRWERGSQQPGAYFRLKLCALFGKSAEELGLRQAAQPLLSMSATVPGVEQAGVPVLWTVPIARNPFFTGRDNLLDQLTDLFSCYDEGNTPFVPQVALTQARVLKGLGGIGKTQIVVEYAYRTRQHRQYTYTLWVDATTRETLLASVQGLAELLPSFPEHRETDQHALMAAMKHWLTACPQPWLLIIDNVEEHALTQPFWPTEGNGHMLFTTRLNATGSFAPTLEVEPPGIQEGTALVLRRAQRQDVSDEAYNAATNIVLALAGLPLALDQAGAYIEETGCSIADYLHVYHTYRHVLLARRGIYTTSYPDSVATTWLNSLQRLTQTNPAAADLLRLCAFLAPEGIPEEFLTLGSACWPAELQQATADPLLFQNMCENLLTCSLIRRLPEQRLLRVHRLVQCVQLDLMEPAVRRHWAERVVQATHEVFPEDPDDRDTWPQCLRYLEHIQACQMLIEQYDLLLVEGASVLKRAGRYLTHQADHRLAESLYRSALAIYERIPAAHHPHIATCLNNLADLRCAPGQEAEAQQLFQRTLSTPQDNGSPHLH